MKKTIINVLVAPLAMVLVASCAHIENQPEPKPTSDSDKKVRTVIDMYPSLEKVKTYIDETLADPTIMWGTDEYITMWINDGESNIFAESAETSADANNGKDMGHFTFETEIGEAGTFSYGGFYPSSALKPASYESSVVTLTLPSEQHPSTDGYDPQAFIMVADPKTSGVIPNPWNASLYRAVALNKLTITGITGPVESITITAPEGQVLAGGRKIDLSKKLSEEESASYDEDKTNVITLIYDEPQVPNYGTIDAFFTSWGMSIANGEVLRIRVKTSENVLYNGGLQAGTAGLNFKENYFNKFTNIDFSKVTQRPADVIEFMEAYANQLRVWKENVGNVSGTHALETSGHIIPGENTITTVSGVTYDKAQAFYVAAKLYQELYDKGKTVDNVTLASAPEICKYPVAPYYEDGDACKLISASPAFILNQVGRQLTFFATKQNDNPTAGYFANYCGAGGNISGYTNIGQTSLERLNLLLIRVFDYLLKNKVYSGVKSAIDGLLFDADLYYHIDQKPNIKAFASEYITVLDEWNRNTGRLNLTAPYKDQPYQGDETANVVEGHYVPYDYTIDVDVLETTYTTSNMFELALRSFLLVCGYDGENTDGVGANKIPLLTTVGGGGLITSLPNISASENYHWKEEGGYYAAEPTNGGYLSNVKNSSTEDKTEVKKDILLNFAMRNVNYPFKGGDGNISNVSRYTGSELGGYYGVFSSARALTTYATFFKYLLDNNLGAASGESLDSVQFDSDLY